MEPSLFIQLLTYFGSKMNHAEKYKQHDVAYRNALRRFSVCSRTGFTQKGLAEYGDSVIA